MRTTLDLDTDIMDLARALADSRQISLGKAVSCLARRGAITPAPTGLKNGFRTFLVPPGTPTFGLDDVRAALDAEDHEMSRFFARPDSGK